MAGLIFVSPGTFTDAADLPQVPPTPVLPIRGAMIDWAADRLPTGGLSSWTDMLGARTLEAPTAASQRPTVVGGGITRRVEFDGENDRIDAEMNISQPCTMVVVARSTAAALGDFILTGGSGSSWNLGIQMNAPGRWIFSTGAGSSILSPPEQTADNGWHVFIVSVDGANSVLNVDGTEATGTIDPVTWNTLRVGASSSAYFGVHLRRLAVIPRATTAPERETLRQQLATHYGI